ncbi:hypothetical protein LQ953_09270 [Sphingomonas sp. IC-56]|uniref:hypothetical protein n=1 Tax=Sphingomonas sp. IC-56 TaxID=2898529 RepID=UPI001E4105C1|nr:hypothetical protein [Sphingomonas sp. IC-56]MCD2324200.1 hypothetical protein [Sphingomonas sp. IC-56]
MIGELTQKVSLAKTGMEARRRRVPAVGWTVPLETVVTRSGSRLADLTWDFSQDHAELGKANWSGPIMIDGMVVGDTSDDAHRSLINVLQQAVAARWLYATRDDGRRWNAKRAYDAVNASNRFVQWLASIGITQPEEITEDILVVWLEEVRVRRDGTPRTYRHQRTLFDPPLLLWRMRSRVDRSLPNAPEGSLPEDYIDAQDDTKPVPLIPRPVLEHVIGAAHRYVAVYSSDIRSARKFLDHLAHQWSDATGRPIPTWKRGDAEYKRFEKWIGNRFGWASATARGNMGNPAPWNEDGAFVIDPDTGLPWIKGVMSRRHLQQLENSLRTSCYIVIAFMTGGRNTEMNQLQVDCTSVRADEQERVREFFIRGKVTKHRGDGQDVEWGVPQIAVHAAGIMLDMCAPWRKRTGSARLFVTQTGEKMNDSIVNNDLKVFLERIGAPYVNGKPFPLTTHQFRVALAQWLGAEPIGELAGAFHLKQLNTAAFRGYLREDPEFRSLFEAFEVQAGTDHLGMLMHEPVISGRMGDEIMASRTPERQAANEAEVRIMNLAQVGREAPSPRVMQKLRKVGRPIYLTSFSTCVFDADAAECLKGRPPHERDRPLTHRCSPLTCANSAITRLQIPAYLENCEAYLAMVADPTSSSSQVELARHEASTLVELIMPHRPVLNAELAAIHDRVVNADAREAETVSLIRRRNEVEQLLDRIDIVTRGVADNA